MMNQLERHLLVVVAGRFVDEHELADSMDRHFAANTYTHYKFYCHQHKSIGINRETNERFSSMNINSVCQ